MTPEFTLRRAVADDLGDILALVEVLHALEGIDMAPAARRAAVAGFIERPEIGGIWVAETGGRIVAYAAVAWGWSIVFGGRDAFLDEICVAEDMRGQGLGAALIERLKPALAAEGAAAVHLEVNTGNAAARRLYARHGFALREGYHLMSAPL